MSDNDLHPYPQLDVLRETIPQLRGNDEFWETASRHAPTEPMLPPYSLDPVGGERQSMVAPMPHELRTPAVLKYPKSSQTFVIASGVNTEISLGFAARSLVVQNLTGNNFLWLVDEMLYLSAQLTMFTQINFREGHEKLTFQWHTALFNATTPGALAGQFATVMAFDEWVL